MVPYTFIRRGVPVREDTYPEPLACEVGWPGPFFTASHSRLGKGWTSIQSGHRVGLGPSAQEATMLFESVVVNTLQDQSESAVR